ncbi:hypothetical protein [Sphingorhabdus sp.]|jgi:hypothetical protein|uniref:hypothetical protein n=2 Tax=Sphingorhabdus sp. TaxID=1902408 RepID=UPI003BAE15CC|nr:hypothetical protein [Sphingomonadales bacterium]MBK9432576.1 hypothetical protein [Sphingomonadales bacterium]MBL0021897.1 hypothetical protein [Sphingomonadales bacterium]
MYRNIVLAGLAIISIVNQPAMAAPITYGCDTPADRFSAIEQQVSLSSFSIKGAIQPNEFRKGKYSPLAQIFLDSADQKYRWAMKVIALDSKAKDAFVFLEMTENGKESDPFLIGSVKIGAKLSFNISVTEGKIIKFRIGEMDGNPELNLGSQATLNIICSTGDFVFSDLEWSDK